MYIGEKAPTNVEEWARDILNKNNIPNANSVPLLIGDDWHTGGDHYIQMNRNIIEKLTNNSEKEQARAEKILLHEAKHYKNNDTGKGLIIYSLSIAPFVYSIFQQSN